MYVTWKEDGHSADAYDACANELWRLCAWVCWLNAHKRRKRKILLAVHQRTLVISLQCNVLCEKLEREKAIQETGDMKGVEVETQGTNSYV